jgi:hypothetical protein
MWDAYKGQGKISDLEYAKPYDTSSQYDPITVLLLLVSYFSTLNTIIQGTPAYMPIELQARSYLFRTASWMPEDTLTRSLKRLKVSKPAAKDIPKPHLAYHFYHDLESVTWFFWDYWLSHFSPTATPHSSKDLKPFAIWRSKLFDVTITGSPERQEFIQQEYDHAYDWIVEQNLHESVHYLASPITFVTFLAQEYEKLQKILPTEEIAWLWPHASFSEDPHDYFIALLNHADEEYSSHCKERDLDMIANANAVSVSSVVRHLDAQNKQQLSNEHANAQSTTTNLPTTDSSTTKATVPSSVPVANPSSRSRTQQPGLQSALQSLPVSPAVFRAPTQSGLKPPAAVPIPAPNASPRVSTRQPPGSSTSKSALAKTPLPRANSSSATAATSTPVAPVPISESIQRTHRASAVPDRLPTVAAASAPSSMRQTPSSHLAKAFTVKTTAGTSVGTTTGGDGSTRQTKGSAAGSTRTIIVDTSKPVVNGKRSQGKVQK